MHLIFTSFPFSPPGLVNLTAFTHGEDDAASLALDGSYAGKATHPSAAPGNDLVNLTKQWNEFGMAAKGRKLAAAYTFLSDVHTLGLQNAQGMMVAQTFYWDMNDETRAWSKRFMARTGRAPSDTQASLYSSMQHYLRGVKTLNDDDPAVTGSVVRTSGGGLAGHGSA